jgi:ribonuclease-3
MIIKKKRMKDRKEIEEKLGVTFKNPRLLKTALTHRSYLNEHRGMNLKNNERFEFLGDAVLELIISSELFKKYPKKPEGELTAIRSAVVRTESLAQESRLLGIGENILMSRGEEESGGKDKDFILANTYEALLGAIYLDQGLDVCREFVRRTALKKVNRVVDQELFIDPKTRVQELIQAKYKVTPTYTLIKEQGPDHDKTFTVGLKVGRKVMSKGTGVSKQKAEEDAARKCIEKLEGK